MVSLYVKINYPALRAALRSIRFLMLGALDRNFSKEGNTLITFHYYRSLLIDALIYVLLIPYLSKAVKTEISKIIPIYESVPYFNDFPQGLTPFWEVETQSKTISKDMEWLLHELGGES